MAVELFYADEQMGGRTDKHDEANNHFYKFYELAPKKKRSDSPKMYIKCISHKIELREALNGIKRQMRPVHTLQCYF